MGGLQIMYDMYSFPLASSMRQLLWNTRRGCLKVTRN